MIDRRHGIIIVSAVAAVAAVSLVAYLALKPAPEPVVSLAGTGNMRVQSPEFEQNEAIPSRFTCDGENVSPRLLISGVPEEAVSLVLVVDDPDAPAGTWVHWLVWNLPPRTAEIAEGSVPPGAVEGLTDFGKTGYGGPCPPSGQHRYFFKLYALDRQLTIGPSAAAGDLEAAMDGHVLDKAGLVGVYSRGR